MVEKITEIIEELEESNKPFWVVALLKMDELVDRWSLVMSAPWVNDTNRSDAFGEILELLKSKLSQEELVSIGQLGLLPKEDHLIDELLKFDSGSTVNGKLNGNMIHEGTVIKSDRNLEWQEAGLFTGAANSN